MYSGFEFVVQGDAAHHWIYPQVRRMDDGMTMIWKHHLIALANAIGLTAEAYLTQLPTGKVKQRLKALAKTKSLPHTIS